MTSRTLSCSQLRELLDSVSDVRTYIETHIQELLRRIYEILTDLLTDTRRTRRGFFTDMLSHVTGLASKDQLRALSHVLCQVKTGIYESARLWGTPPEASLLPTRLHNRMHNIFDILRINRTSLCTIQFDFLQARLQARQMLLWQNIVVAKALHLLANTSVQLTEIEPLYQGIQSLMAGDISHFIIPHDAGEFCIIPDLNFCNESMDLNDVYTVHYPINLAYLSEFFIPEELFNLTADKLLNHTVGTELPDLAVVDKMVHEKFAEEKAAAFDMDMVINSTKTSAKVYDNLAHYLFYEMITTQDNAGDFDFFSPWT